MSEYHEGQRELQDRFDTRRLADRLRTAGPDAISEAFARFIEARDMFFLATADANGVPECSYKGGEPGFVRVVDERTIAFPLYDGNGMFLSAGNIEVNPHVGLLFIDFEGGSRLRFNGTASIDVADPLLASWPEALMVVRVTGEAVFANCRRYVHRLDPGERSPFVPAPDTPTPVPDWKRNEWFDGTLAEGDPALDPSHPQAPATPEF